MAEKKIQPKRPTGDEPAAGARKAETKTSARRALHRKQLRRALHKVTLKKV
jgi:hypothetical protein